LTQRPFPRRPERPPPHHLTIAFAPSPAASPLCHLALVGRPASVPPRPAPSSTTLPQRRPRRVSCALPRP
jgi:hypothetical protein